MQTKTVINHLSELPILSEVVIQWFEKSHVEANANVKLTDEQWSEIVSKSETVLKGLWSDVAVALSELAWEYKND